MKHIKYQTVSGFQFSIDYGIMQRKEHTFEIDSHVHDKCEIYVNLSGDISFMVENNIYPVKRGNAIITRPYEYHHCIYHSDAPHEFYWILFSVDGNEQILTPFFERPFGQSNLITFDKNDGEHLIKLCEDLYKNQIQGIEQYLLFWKMMRLLEQSSKIEPDYSQMHNPEISASLNYIESRLNETIRISDLALLSNVSVNTLERHFYQELNMTPMEYIKKKRLNSAASFLRQGYNVQQAGMESGFNDISYFIKLFKQDYGMTPLSYSKYYKNK